MIDALGSPGSLLLVGGTSDITVATARRCSSVAWVAIRRRASSGLIPRSSTIRRTRSSSGACTTSTSSIVPY